MFKAGLEWPGYKGSRQMRGVVVGREWSRVARWLHEPSRSNTKCKVNDRVDHLK
jgi:hypothetical protein